MKRVKILSIFLVLALMVSVFGGCKASTPKTTIEVLTWHGPDSATKYYAGYKQIADDYMKTHKDIAIKIKYEADDTYGSILETGFAGGTASDIIQMKSAQRATYNMNLLNLRTSLNEANPYDTRNAKWIDNFVGGEGMFPVEDNGTDANSILFVPNDGNPEVFAGKMYIYNKSIIKNAGLDPETTPATWKEMFTWLDALKTNADIAPIAGSSDLGGKVSQIGYQFGENYADKFFADEFNTAEFTDSLFYDKLYILTCYAGNSTMPLDSLPYYPAMFKLMKQHITYFQTSWIENSVETEILSFVSGKAAMMNTSFWDYDSLISSLSKTAFPDGYGLFPVPYMTSDSLDYAVTKGWITQQEADAARPYSINRYSTASGVGKHEYGFTVNKKVAEDPAKLAATIDFLKYMSSKEAQDKYVVTASSLSPVKEVKLIDQLTNFMIKEPATGFSKNILGYTVIEWGKSGWDVDLIKYINGETTMEAMVATISAPEWKGDIPTVDTLKAAVETAKTDLAGAADADKEAKQSALNFAQERLKLFETYYYNQTGPLKELR